MQCSICSKNNNELMTYAYYGQYEYVLANININLANNNYNILHDKYCSYCNLEDTLLTICLNLHTKRHFNIILDKIIKRIIECKKYFTLYEINKLKESEYYNYFLDICYNLQKTIYNNSNVTLPFELIYNIFEFNFIT